MPVRKLVALLLALFLAMPAQQEEEPALRITVTLVQVDAVVVDSKGHHVSDLKPEDFEVKQDGKVQKITKFSYVTTSLPQRQTPAQTPQDRQSPNLPPPVLKASQVRRTMAIVVDDLGLSFESTAQVR